MSKQPDLFACPMCNHGTLSVEIHMAHNHKEELVEFYLAHVSALAAAEQRVGELELAVRQMGNWIEGRNEIIEWRDMALVDYFELSPHQKEGDKENALEFLLREAEKALEDGQIPGVGLSTTVDQILENLARHSRQFREARAALNRLEE